MNIVEIGRQIGEQIAKEPGICFYPGGFKPPHKGHFAAAQSLASKPYITQVNVLIGQGIRGGITAEQSKAVWDVYLKSQPNPKIKVEIAKDKSPIRDIYRWFADDLNRKAYVAAASKEADDLKYFEGLKNAFGDRVQEEIVDDQFVDSDGERVSGTDFRSTIATLRQRYLDVKNNPGDKKALNDYNTTYLYFKSLFPEAVIQKGYLDDIQKILGINFPEPTSLQELKDIIPGGLAKGKTIVDIAKKYKTNIEKVKKQLTKGIKTEMEHTTSKAAAKEIAMDHLWEDLYYYDKLKKIEESQPNPKKQPQWVWLEYKNQNKLNPLVFGEDEKVDTEVKDLLLKIASYFWEGLELPQPFDDVRLTGSSVNYNYTPTSDIDLHIIVDFNKFDNPELVKKYFDEAKINWNRVHDLKLGKQNIEIYIQDSNEKHTSSGVYSLMNDEWIDKPSYENVEVSDKDIEKKAKIFKQQIDKLVKTGKNNPEKSIELINKIKERLKNFRQTGLDKSGEYSLENLAFKNLRNTGYLEKLSNLKNTLVDKTLSLTESIDKNSLFEKFMSYACQELQIKTPPTLEVKYEFGEDQPSFGAYVPSDHHIFINPSNRNVVDILRTLAHELVHAKQNELGILTLTSGETGSEHENDANSIAGILMRDYGKLNPSIYNIGVLNEAKENKQKITRIYFDLDGVLAGFDDQFKKYNKEGLDFKSYIGKYGSNEAWDIINKGKTKFWSEMPWNPGGKELYNRVMKLADEKNIEVWILSSPGLDPNGDAKKGKNEWVDKHLNIPLNRRVYKQAKDKHTEAKPGYMLIDDMGKNVAEFIQSGGTGIKNNPEDSTESIKKLYKFKYE